MAESPHRTEVTEEVQERLEVLELDRTPRSEKLAREAAFLEGASEVRYAERAFRPRHRASIESIRAAVDELEVRGQPRELPPVPALPQAPPPSAIAIRAEHRRALEGIVPGELVAVDTVYRTDTGEVVEATLAQDGERTIKVYLIEDGQARPMSTVESRIDELPAPRARDEPSATAPRESSTPPATPPPVAEKKSRFSFPKRKEKAPDGSAPEGEKKRRFGFGKK